MRYGSVCSGIEAATMAWHHMGWEPAFFSEIEAFPRAVLEHRYPAVPVHGDFTTIEENQYGKIDLLVGGTPCQSFSVAGLRGGLDDERGNLALEFCRLADRERPRWIVWENVPGVLSSNGGRDFGSILGALAQLGYGLAYRVLDAQYFGVAQRRRRVFVVGYLGDWRRAAAVLFERHSMSGHPAPSREKRQDATHSTAPCLTSSGRGVERTGDTRGQDPVVAVERRHGPAVNISNGEPRLADVTGTLDCWSMKGRGSSQQQAVLTDRMFVPDVVAFDTTQVTSPHNYSNPKSGDPVVAVERRHGPAVSWPADVANTLDTDFATKWGQNNQHVNAGCPMFVPAKASCLTAGTGQRFDTDTDTDTFVVHGTQDPCVPESTAFAIQAGALRTNPNSGPDGVGVQADHAYTLEARAEVQAVVVPFDTTQVTSPHNYSNPQPGDPVHPLAAGAHAPAIAFQPTADCLTAAYRTTGNAGCYATLDGLDTARTLTRRYDGSPCPDRGPDVVAFDLRGRDGGSQLEGPHDTANIRAASGVFYGGQGAKAGSIAYSNEISPTLKAGNSGTNRSPSAHIGSAVRRLTPVECERLQGFPDGFTAIPWRKKPADHCPDGPRYKALGNSMAVPVMRWIGQRIQMVEDLTDVL